MGPLIFHETPAARTPARPALVTLAGGHAVAHELPMAHEEDGSAAKKRRISQVLPHVSQAVKALPRSDFKADDIAMHALATIVSEPAAIYDLLPSRDDKARAESIVRNLASQARFQIRTGKRLASELGSACQSSESTPEPVSESRPESRPEPKPEPGPGLQRRTPPRDEPLIWRRRLEPSTTPVSSWFGLRERPYQSARDRQLIDRGLGQADNDAVAVCKPTVYHVDFTPEEVAKIVTVVSQYLPHPEPPTIQSLTRLCHKYNIPSLLGKAIPYRTAEDVRNFCSDLLAGEATDSTRGRVLTLEETKGDSMRRESRRTSRVASLLLAREIEGNRGFGKMRQYANFENEFRKVREDAMTLVAEFTNCAGDVSTTTWVPGDNVICGTTNHSDTHNQQYNKPGNLLLCSTSRGELRAFADHRIPRPVVEKGENSTEAMRQSQDPWLYSSVVSSDYDPAYDLAYTSSFDRTVKVWQVGREGTSMTALATWHLEGNVNFVCATRDGSGRVAAAADVPSQAVRIYTVNRQDISASPYVSFSCSRTDADDGSGKWAYFPATMQWGRSPGCYHILAVGYSPRSLSLYEHDIPEDKRNSGEVTLWDADRGCRLHVTTATTSNFFEIVWHPTMPCFIAATAIGIGQKTERGIRTRIHLFKRDNDRLDGGYHEFQNLDCCAADINELTLMPNSPAHAYVTAGCTDGNVYVWDTAQGDKPIHVLRHGHPVDDYHEDREREDTGVKFTAWGISPDRFYTGSSDGVVKVWNVRRRRRPLVRDLLVAPGPISCGAFSPDMTRMVIGDATGRVFVFSLDERDASEKHYVTMPGGQRIRRPVPFIAHPEPPPPNTTTTTTTIPTPFPPLPAAAQGDAMDVDIEVGMSLVSLTAAQEARKIFLDTGRLVIHRNPVIGAVQGPNYAATGLFRLDAHLNDDPRLPLLPSYERQQRASIESSCGTRARSVRRLKDPASLSRLGGGAYDVQHEMNRGVDFDVGRLERGALEELVSARAALWVVDEEEDWGFEYEE